MNSMIAFFVGFIIGCVGFLLIRNIFEKWHIAKMIEAIEKAKNKNRDIYYAEMRCRKARELLRLVREKEDKKH